MVVTRELHLQTEGHTDTQDITGQVQELVRETDLRTGIVTLFCPGSTGGLTTIEYESGAVADLKQVFDEIAPPDRDYRHHQKWGDDNGSAHLWNARHAFQTRCADRPITHRALCGASPHAGDLAADYLSRL